MSAELLARMVGARIRECRDLLGWSLRETGVVMGVGRNTVMRLEAGTQVTWGAYLPQLATAFRMPLGMLVEEDEARWQSLRDVWYAGYLREQRLQEVDRALDSTCKEVQRLLHERTWLLYGTLTVAPAPVPTSLPTTPASQYTSLYLSGGCEVWGEPQPAHDA